jgi:hypothetical protein
MRGKVAGIRRRSASSEVFGGRDCNLAKFRTNPDCNQIALYYLAHADSSIEPACHDIHDLIVMRDVEHDLRPRDWRSPACDYCVN